MAKKKVSNLGATGTNKRAAKPIAPRKGATGGVVGSRKAR